MAMRALTALVVLGAVVAALAPAAVAADADEAWAALAKGGHVAMIRHGNAPPGYGGDPPGYRLGDCSTQRNLDDKGREQGRLLGELFRQRGVRVDSVLASPFCRCVETAQLMAVGPVETSYTLLGDPAGAPAARFVQLKELVAAWRGPGTLVLVTHALTVRPLAGFLPEQAETVVIKPAAGDPRGGIVVGRIAPPR